MASARTRVWGPTHPSAAFLIKCAKEREKLRATLQRQLQEHMLYMLEEKIFSDTLIAVNSGKFCRTENNSPGVPRQHQHPDLPHFCHAHKSVLKVRVPAFYDHLSKHEETNLGVKSYRSFLEESQLQQYLRKVYTDDDIRKHECEALRLSKAHAEIQRQNKVQLFHEKQLINKHIIDVDEFERESANSSCTENFVTPKTSPITPDKKIDIPDMFHSHKRDTRITEANAKLLLSNKCNLQQDIIQNIANSKELNAETPNQGDISEGYVSEIDNTHDDESRQEGILKLEEMKHSNSTLEPNRKEANVTSVDIEEKSDFVAEDCYSPETTQGFPLPLDSEVSAVYRKTDDDYSDSCILETPRSGGMVRSNTFDLHRQACLDDITDAKDSQWNSHELSEKQYYDKFQSSQETQKYTSENRNDINKKLENEMCSPSFFLHDHTPSPKSNLFRDNYIKDSSLIASQELMENSMAGNVHFRRLDTSMSDSGFMSHSTFSMLSDAGMPSSITSSLVMSSDGALSPSASHSASESNVTNHEHARKLSGSMFPFYIDINSLPPEETVRSKEEKIKHSPSSVYMYIDASKPDPCVIDHEINGGKEQLIDSEATYDALLLKYDKDIGQHRSKTRDRLVKVQSSPQLDVHNQNESNVDSPRSNRQSRPQSCYMYIDLDSVKNDKIEDQKTQRIKQAPQSVSMFIDLNEDLNETVNSVQDLYSHQILENTNRTVNNTPEVKKSDNINLTNCKNSSELLDTQKNHLADASFLLNCDLETFEQLIQLQSLMPSGSQRSASAPNSHYFSSQNCSKSLSFSDDSDDISLCQKTDSLHGSSDILNCDHPRSKKRSYSTFSVSSRARTFSDLDYIQSESDKMFERLSKASELLTSGNHDIDTKFQTYVKADSQVHTKGMAEIDKGLAFEKSKQKSSSDTEAGKGNNIDKETGLLPMSPILRRKTPNKELPKPSPPLVAVKASTRPQDVDAMTFRRSDREESPKLSRKLSQEDGLNDSGSRYGSPARKKTDQSDEPKSSSESLKLGSEGLSESADISLKDKSIDPMSHSESSIMTMSGGDTSSSEKHTSHEASKDRLLQSPPSWSLSYDFEDDSETIYSEVSDVSSSLGGIGGIASLERRWREGHSPEGDSSIHGTHSMFRMLEACSKLGEDLLRMFLEEINTDIIIEVDGKQIKAHRCILASRCKYFATMLKGSWSASSDKSITLQGFSHAAVHFALCHIYSGAINLPKEVNIAELALLADMLNLDTLTDVIVFHLKMHYCHFFHRKHPIRRKHLKDDKRYEVSFVKPCAQCTQGVVECLPLAASCGLHQLRDKCIYWLGKYFTRTWPNKAFASLPEEFRDLCYNSTLQNLTVDTVIEMTLNCDRLITTLPHVKWTEPIFGMVTRLLQDCIYFMAQNFDQILSCDGFLALGKGQSWNVTALEDDIISAIELMTPDIACKSFVKLSQILPLAESDGCPEYGELTQNFVDLLYKINRHCERYLIHNANKVVHCKSWAFLAPDVQKRIKDAAVIVFEFEKPTAPPPRLSSLHRKLKKQRDGEEVSCMERSTYPKKGKTVRIRKFCKDSNQFSDKSVSSQGRREKEGERSPHQRREVENIVKKIVSPIKEEAQTNSLESSSREASDEAISHLDHDGQSKIEADSLGHASQKGSPDVHEEDSLKEMQDLPQDHTLSAHNHLNDFSEVLNEAQRNNISRQNSDDKKVNGQCSDNPDSLDVTEENSFGSKDELSGSVEDALVNEKETVPVSEPVNVKNHSQKDEHRGIPVKMKTTYVSSSLLPKSNLPSVARDTKVPPAFPSLSHLDSKSNSGSQSYCDKSSTKSSSGMSFVPLAKVQDEPETRSLVSPEISNKDLVAEIDADSRMVTHCLQEAEMLEQQLSRKLQRQHQAVSASNLSHYIQSSPVRSMTTTECRRSARTPIVKVQKSSSATQMKSLCSAPTRGRSPGSQSAGKSISPSPSSQHMPRMLRGSDSVKDQKISGKKPLAQKSGIASTQRSFRSMESITTATHTRHVSVTSASSTKRISSRSSKSRSTVILNTRESRASSSNAK